jgi:hypothetical protein
VEEEKNIVYPVQETAVTDCVRATRSSCDPIWFLIPLAFVIITNARIAIPVTGLADQIVDILGKVYPVILEQYTEIRRLGSPGDETRYLFFIICAIAFEAIMTVWTLKRYLILEPRPEIRTKDLWAVGLAVVFVSYVLFLDGVKKDPRWFWNFYVDAFGLYYFRQAMELYLLGSAATAILLVILHIARSRKISG